MKSTKRINPVPSLRVEIALESPVVKEELPFPMVHYPNHYGAFIGFSESASSGMFFCNCAQAAIENYFSLNDYELKSNWGDRRISAPLSNHFFPNQIAISSLKSGDVRSLVKYRDKICHRCNLATPSLRYCDEMYGGNFKQFYGWYIHQTSLRLGVRGLEYISEITPDFLIEQIDQVSELVSQRNEMSENNVPYSFERFLEVSDIDKKIGKINRRIAGEIENVTREEFGFRKIGEGNVSETILTKIVSKIFLDDEILKHHRPNWLDGLELDIFIPSRNLGIEYQGQQHFYPIKAWGGKDALEKLRERDQKKRLICAEKGVQLIEIDFTEPLVLSYIKDKIYRMLS